MVRETQRGIQDWALEIVNRVLPATRLEYLPEHVEFSIQRIMNNIQLRPMDLGLHIQLGTAFIQVKSYDKAIHSFDQAISMDPGNRSSGALLLLGVAHLFSLTFVPANRCFEKYCMLKPARYEGYLLHAISMMMKGELEIADKLIDSALMLEKRNCYSRLVRARHFELCGNDNMALDEYEKILVDFPNHPLATTLYHHATSRLKQTGRLTKPEGEEKRGRLSL